MSTRLPSGGWFRAFVLAGVAVGVVAVALAHGQSVNPPSTATGPGVLSAKDYGSWVMLPALSAIGLAVITRRVLPSLAVGVLVASYMLLPCMTSAEKHGAVNPVVATVWVAVVDFLWQDSLCDHDHIKILVFTALIAAMVGVIGASGGTRAVVEIIARRAAGRRGGQLIAWAAGLVVFFDDYANTMIVGPTMQPIFDRLKLSRAKLAYIVDSTAAPVASIALIGTWLGAEIGFIQAGLDRLADVPAFLEGVDGWQAFLLSIPRRYYAIFAIITVALVAATGRDLGPMRRAERQAVDGVERGRVNLAEPTAAVERASWWMAGVPVMALIGVTLGVLFYTGWYGVERGEARTFITVLKNADAYDSIMCGAIVSLSLALGLGLLWRALGVGAAFWAVLAGLRRVSPALAILALAWALSAASTQLQLGEIVSDHLKRAEFAAAWLPLSVFLCAAVVSFATGTSWGTMAILCPVVVTVAARLAADLPADRALDLFYSAVGGVLAGAIFGDHCSPISDTTVLSSISSGCRLESHVWTQLPYALAAAAAEIVFGDLLSAYLGVHWAVGLVLGTVALYLLVRYGGKTVPCGDGVPSAGTPRSAEATEPRR